MNDCQSCAHWIIARETVYGDGTTMRSYEAPAGKGHCGILEIETGEAFGCNAFSANSGLDNRLIIRKPDPAWSYWAMGPCPDCQSKGNANDGACHRCAGTGQVRHYEDGHIGEERTRLHPKEREVAAKPKCGGCQRDVEADWMACPRCGKRLDAPALVEKVADTLRTG